MWQGQPLQDGMQVIIEATGEPVAKDAELGASGG